MAHLTSHQALKLAADFAKKAEQMRTSDGSDFQTLANIYEKASRVAFLRAHLIANDEELRPRFGENLPRAVFAIA